MERDARCTPIPGSADWESSVFDPVEDVPENIMESPAGDEVMESITDTIEEEPLISPPGIAYPGYNRPVTDLGELPPLSLEPETNEIFNEEVFNKVFTLPDPTGFTNFPYAFEGPWDLFKAAKENMETNEFTDQELLDLLIRTGYLVDDTLEEK